MGAEAIIQKINEKASAESAAIRSAGEQRADDAAKRILTAAREAAAKTGARGKKEAENIRYRERLISEMEAGKNALASKRAVLDEAFAAALEQLCALSGADWEAKMTELALGECMPGEVTVRFSQTDLERYGDRLPKLLKHWGEELSRQFGEPCRLTLGEAAPIRGGMLFVGETCDLDASFEMLLRDVRERKEYEVASLLFYEGEGEELNARLKELVVP